MVRPFNGLVLHIQQGTEVGTDATFHDPNTQVSAHFGNPKSSGLDQWVDTDDVAFAQVAGNTSWISLENEGNSGDSLTPSQLLNAAILLAWLNLTESIPLQLAETPSDSGLGFHAMGGVAWGNHPNCPGRPIIDQRVTIVAAARALILNPTVSAISPTSGPAGTTVTIAGSGFTFATNVGFGNVSAAQMSVDSDTQITVIAPRADGTVDIVVATLVGTSVTSSADQFTFADLAPHVTSVNPASGSANGGSSVVISGSGFTGAISVGFGTTSSSQMNVDTDSQITATAPPGVGTVDVVVTTQVGSSATTAADQFTYS